MGKIQIPKKLRVEDFSGDNKELIEKIAFIYNSFSDEVYQSLNGGLDSSNINRQLVDLTVKLSPSGVVTSQQQIKILVSGRIRGVNVISANNTVNSTIYPLSAPFVTFTTNNNILTILNVSGLQPNSEYKLCLELIV